MEDLAEKFSKVLIITKKKQGDFAIECKISPGTLSKALERSSFSEDIVDKIYDRYRIRKQYWTDGKEPIIEENGTYVEVLTKKDPNEEVRILTRNIDRMGAMNEYLLEEIKKYKDRFGDL